MKVGIKKLNENDWLVHAGCASIKMDHFSVELLRLTLEHLLALNSGQAHSILDSYISLGKRITQLDPVGTQKLTRVVDDHDLKLLLLAAKDASLTEKVLQNVGGILAKQLKSDLQKESQFQEDEAKQAIRRIVEQMFLLESNGDIEFDDGEAEYI